MTSPTDVTPKTESPTYARDELIEWNRRMLHGQEPDFTMLVDRVRREAASKAVAEVLDRLERGVYALVDNHRKSEPRRDAAADVLALIASERKP